MTIKKSGYGIEPQKLGQHPIEVSEMFFYMYLPIKLAGSEQFAVPPRLSIFNPLICAAIIGIDDVDLIKSMYVYLTAKHVYVTPDYRGNRPGWHCDGFMTDDINAVWSDQCPTEFALQPFELIQDDKLSMQQMKDEANENNIITYPDNELLLLDERQVHRVSMSSNYVGMRTFVKISFSKNKYNLKGNSHNYLLDYNWKMHDREKLRNVTDFNGDSVEQIKS